jgi:hypothetical protein
MLALGSGLRSWALLCFRAHCAYVCQRNGVFELPLLRNAQKRHKQNLKLKKKKDRKAPTYLIYWPSANLPDIPPVHFFPPSAPLALPHRTWLAASTRTPSSSTLYYFFSLKKKICPRVGPGPTRHTNAQLARGIDRQSPLRPVSRSAGAAGATSRTTCCRLAKTTCSTGDGACHQMPGVPAPELD